MRLFFIACVHPDDSEINLDLFVWHNDKALAIKLWRAWVLDQMGADLAAGPDRVFIVPCDRPDGQRIGILEWHKDVVEI